MIVLPETMALIVKWSAVLTVMTVIAVVLASDLD